MIKINAIPISLCILATSLTIHAAPCAFDSAKDCVLQRDILNDVGTNGLKYYSATNYDHRMSGEINVYKYELTTPYTDAVNAPGQIKFLGVRINPNLWHTGEMMTRHELHLPPYDSPERSNQWTTKEARHGYLEVVVKMPKCDTSVDGRCQAGTAPPSYAAGLWPAIWLEPTMDANWPLNGEIDISEAYLQGTDYKTSTAAIHFFGRDPRCSFGDCVGPGFPLPNSVASDYLWTDFHTWGFEWQPDPTSTRGGQILNGYFDNRKVWGPLRTDTLPADGPGAIARGFNDPDGGYYLIVNLAIGGPYAGAVNPQLLTSSMYLQSAKAYTVDGDIQPPPPVKTCLPPTNIHSMYSSDKRQVTLAWLAPANSAPIKHYRVSDWQKRVIWNGKSPSERVFQDQSLPGSNGNFVYFLSTVCDGDVVSSDVRYAVRVTLQDHLKNQKLKQKQK